MAAVHKKSTDVVIGVIFTVFALIWLMPLLGILVNSFRPFTNAASTGWWKLLSERQVTMDNYQRMLSDAKFLRGFKNSVLITLPTILLVMVVCSMTSYGLVFGKLRCGRKLYLLLCGLIVIPAEITLLPTLIILRTLGLANTYPGIWMSHIANIIPFGVFLIGSFMKSIPMDLIEAAEIDGCSVWRIFTRIIFPLSSSSVASLAIFDFLWVWNDLLRSLVIIPNVKMQPLTAVLANSAGGYGEYVSVQAAGAILLLLPPLLVFLLFQKAFVNGVLQGAVKS